MTIDVRTLEDRWDAVRGRLKERWGELSDDDLRLDSGSLDALVHRIERRTGEAREAIERFLHDLLGQGASLISHPAERVEGLAHLAGDRVHEGYDRAAVEARRRFELARRAIRRAPAPSVAAAFGLGVLTGLVVGLALRSR